MTYRFSGELQTIYTTLVVRLWYSRTFDRKELWRNAAEFATTKGKTTGILFEKLGDGEGKLSTFFETGVPDELQVVFVEFVHRHLAKYARDVQREMALCLPESEMPRTGYRLRHGAQAARFRKEFHHLPGLRQTGALPRPYRGAAGLGPGGRKGGRHGCARDAGTGHPGAGTNSHRPHASDLRRGQPDFPRIDQVRLRHRRRSRIQGQCRHGQREKDLRAAQERRFRICVSARPMGRKSST